MSKTKIYKCYRSVISRCHNIHDKDYNDYGKKGRRVALRWLKGFDNFLEDMGLPPSKAHTIDRIDNEKGYSKENCQWATRKEQANNRSSNHLITINGKTQNLTQWSKELNIHPNKILYRISKNWDVKTYKTKSSNIAES